MSRVELNIVALGDFTSVTNQIKAFQAQIDVLQKNLAGVGVSSSLSKDLNNISAQFKQTLLSTGQFTASTITMANETEKFGAALSAGKLKLSDYYNIIKMRSSEAVTQMKALAVEQTKLQNSIMMSDPTKKGVLSVFTPTQIDKVANATKIAANEANLYAIAVNKGSQSLINWGKNTQWAGRQLTVGMSMPLIMFGSQATKVFSDVNTEIVRLQKVYGTGLQQPTQQALDSIKQLTLGLAKELASTMGVSVKDTAAMAADLAATGKTGNDLIVATREAMRLSKLGELDTQAAMKATVSLQNVYKLSTQDLSGAVNFLNAVENQTSTSLQDLVDGIPRVGPIVQQLGGSFKDTAIMMVAMKEAGVPAAQSANAIKSAIASLINPTKQAKDAFAAYNINLAGIATSTKGNPVQMIMQLQSALKGLAPLAQAQLIEKLFGKFQQARIQALITNLGAANSQTKTAFDLMNANSAQLAGVANAEMKTATESATGKYKRAMETFKADLIPVGQMILTIGTKLLNFGNAISKLFGGLPGPIKTVMGALAIGVALAGPIIMLTGLMGNFIGFLIRGIFNLKQLATGGKTLGQLLTPELIAAQNAAQIFSGGIIDDVNSVGLLSKAIADLTAEIMAMNAAMSASAGGLALKEVAGFKQMTLPGFSNGGVVPGTGNSDSFAAMLTPGETVLTKDQTNQYRPIVRAMVQGTLPGFHEGYYTDPSNPNAKPQLIPPHSHVGQEEIGKGSRINEASGNVSYYGPQSHEPHSGSAPAPLQGGASYISRMTGLGDKLNNEVTPAVDNILASLGFGPLGESSQRSQVGLMHLSPERVSLPGDISTRKKWDLPDVAAGSQGENQFLNYFDKDLNPKLAPYFKQKAELVRDAMLKGITDPKQIQSIQDAFSTIISSDQPVSEHGIKMIQGIGDSIVKDIKDNIAPEGIVGKNGITGAGKDVVWTAEVARRQRSGELPSVASLTADKWIQEAQASEAARPKSLAGASSLPMTAGTDNTSGRYDFAKFTPAQVEANKRGLDQLIQTLKAAGLTGTETFKDLQSAYAKAMQSFDQEAIQLEASVQEIENKISTSSSTMSKKALRDLENTLASQKSRLQQLGLNLAEGYALGITEGEAAITAASSNMAKSAALVVARTQKSASPAWVSRLLGRYFGQGYAQGMQDEVPLVEAAGTELAGAAKTGASGRGAVSGKLGMGLMAGGMVSSMVGGQVGQSLGSAMMSGSTAAMMTGNPYIIAAATLLPLVTKGVGAVIAAEQKQKQVAKDTWTSSSDVAKFFGSTVQDTASHLGSIAIAYDKINSSSKSLSSNLGVTNAQLSSFSSMVKSLPKDNPLSVMMDKIKNTSDSGAISSLVTSFVNIQTAIGNIDPAKAKELKDLMLAASGHSNLIGSTSVAGSQSAAIAAAVKGAQGGAGLQQSGFWGHLGRDLAQGIIIGEINRSRGKNKEIQQSVDSVINQVMMAAINSKSLGQIKTAVDGIAAAGYKGAQGIAAFERSLASAADRQKVEVLAKMGFNLKQIAEMLAYLGAGKNIDLTKGLAGVDIKGIEKFLSTYVAPSAATSPQVVALNGISNNLQKQVTLNDKAIKLLEAKKKKIDAELKTQRDISNEMQRQHDYAMSQQDLANQAKQAMISGDYLSAATLGQQARYGTMQFQQQGKTNALQNKSDALGQQIADLQDKNTQLKDSVDKNTTAIDKATAAYNSKTPVEAPQGTLKLPMTGQLGANTAHSVKDAYDLAYEKNPKDAKGLKPMPGEVGIDPSKWNNKFGFGIPAFNSREAIKKYAKVMGYTYEKGKDTLFEIDHNGLAYMFKVLKDGNIQMEGKPKKITMPGVNAANSVKPSGSLPSFGSSGISGTTALAGSTVYNINMNVNSNSTDPKAVADHVVKQITVATAKKNTSNKVTTKK